MCWLIDFRQINVIPQKFCIMSIIPTELISSLQLGELYFSLASHPSLHLVTCSHQRAGMQDNNWPCLLWSKELSHPKHRPCISAASADVLSCCYTCILRGLVWFWQWLWATQGFFFGCSLKELLWFFTVDVSVSAKHLCFMCFCSSLSLNYPWFLKFFFLSLKTRKSCPFFLTLLLPPFLVVTTPCVPNELFLIS